MNKLMMVGLSALMVANVVGAQDVVSSQREPVQVVGEASVMSAYVWRGMIRNDGGVVQPQLTLAQYGFSLNVWANYDIDHNFQGVHNDFSEVDFSLAYALPIPTENLSVDIGIVKYLYPNSVDATGSAAEDTQEAYVTVTFDSVPVVIPSVTMFGDFGEAEGFYTLFEAVAPFDLSDVFSVEAGASAGYGSTSYNKHYWNDGRGLNDYNVFGGASYELTEQITLSAMITYTWLDGVVRSVGTDAYQSDNILWGGANLSYEF